MRGATAHTFVRRSANGTAGSFGAGPQGRSAPASRANQALILVSTSAVPQRVRDRHTWGEGSDRKGQERDGCTESV